MTTVFIEMSVSLDGFAAGPDVSQEHPMGVGGTALHYWLMGGGAVKPTDADRRVAEEMMDGTRAFIMGRRTFDVGLPLWGDDGAFGRPCFVVTSRPAERVTRGPTTFDFVASDIDEALTRARRAAGDANVCIMGGPTLAREYLAAGVVDELRLHLIPTILGRGTRLLEDLDTRTLAPLRTVATPLAHHLHYAIGEALQMPVRVPSPP
jgi:dihydrofolate reductase